MFSFHAFSLDIKRKLCFELIHNFYYIHTHLCTGFFPSDMEVTKEYIYFLDNILSDICTYLHVPKLNNNVIRTHTKKLEELGEISFPLNIKNWHTTIDHKDENLSTIFDYISSKIDANFESVMSNFKCESEKWSLPLNNIRLIKDNIHCYFRRQNAFLRTIAACCDMKQNYGAIEHCPNISLNFYEEKKYSCKIAEMDLVSLRLIILRKVTQNLIDFKLETSTNSQNIELYLTTKRCKENDILCGDVINENGKKESIRSAEELFRKRSIDMRLMAEHKYGLRVKNSELWREYFDKLGEASVTIELLQNKPHKNVKISLNGVNCANKGASFIFYNCARISTLFKEFEMRVDDGIYPQLIPLEEIDFSLLNQPEEWELLYVYIMQYPILMRSCLRDVEKGVVNPHYLVSFLSNMCAIFSVYYRRVRILVTPKPHLISTLHARIYLLKSLQQVFHKTLELLNIDPVKEM